MKNESSLNSGAGKLGFELAQPADSYRPAVAALCLSGQFNLCATQGEDKREGTGIGRSIHPIEENESASARIIRELKRWLPRSRMPTAILSRHNLNWLAPVGQYPGWILCAAPPQPSFWRHFTPSHPDASEDSLKSAVPLPNAEIEHLLLRCGKDSVLAPVCAPIGAFGIAVNQVVFVVRTRYVPHLPFAVVIQEIGLVDAAVLPVLDGSERGFRLILPLLSVPFEEADRVGPQRILAAPA